MAKALFIDKSQLQNYRKVTEVLARRSESVILKDAPAGEV